MKNIAVIYKSNYGTTKRYAGWIAEALGADLIERSFIKPEKLMAYDIVVYGGGIDYKKLSIVHRTMMAMMKKMTIGKKSDEELSDEEHVLIDTYGNQVDFTNRQAIQPIVDYIRNEVL